VSDTSPFSPASIAQSVHESLGAALEAIPPGKKRALLFDGRVEDGKGTVQAMYVERLGDGWAIEVGGKIDTEAHTSAHVALIGAW